MQRIYLIPPGDAGTKSRMPRRKIFERQLNLPMTGILLSRIDAALRHDIGEVRTTFIRDAIERELQRREKIKKPLKNREELPKGRRRQ
jgi:hypothetical protein